MKLGGRLAAAIEVLEAIETRHRPVSEALKDWGTAHRFAGSGDRAVIGNLVYDALRWRASTAAAMGSDAPRALVLGMVARRWPIGPDGLAAALGGDAHAPAPLSAEEAAGLGTDPAAAPAEARADLPAWIAGRFERMFGADWVAEGAALALRPPLDMRVNGLKSEPEKTARTLAQFSVVSTPYAPDGLRIAATVGEGRHPNVQVEPAFQKGWFEIQDEGSQLAAALVGAKPGEQILDLCAGAGGKTLALANAMKNKGQLFATDNDRARLAPIFERIKRAGIRNVQVRPARASLDDLEGRLDAVLIDAPCTGTGVWRRRPDAKWRLTERAVADRMAEQAALLVSAARYVKPGGRLVYVTCSLLPEEDQDQVAACAAANPAFRPLDAAAMLAAADLPDETRGRLAQAALAVPGGLVLSPHRTGTDGFFVAVLRRGS